MAESAQTNMKEVYFDIFCKLCKYSDTEETGLPCDECLTQGYNKNSHTPIKFKGKE